MSADQRAESESHRLEDFRNLGPASARILRAAGIRSRTDLERAGAVAAFLAARRAAPNVTLNLLWAIAGGLQNHDWRNLTQREQHALLSGFRTACNGRNDTAESVKKRRKKR